MALTVNAYCVGGTSVTCNIEVRTTIGTPGTDILGTDLIATTDGVVGGIINNTIPVGSWLWLDISAVSGQVSKLVVTLGVT